VPRITSVYRQTTKPAEVAQWEAQAERAETDTAALVQLTYHLLLQMRTVKQLLFGTLLVIPAAAVVCLVLLRIV